MTDPTSIHRAADAAAEERLHAVERNLLPIVSVAGRDVHWTMDERQAHYGCPAVSVAVMKDGVIDWVGAWGRRNIDDPTPADPDTVFLVASCSKPVTGVMVLQQVDRGVIDLDTDVNTYLRRYQVPHNEFTDAHPVTLRRILSHTAGLNINGWGVTPNDFIAERTAMMWTTTGNLAFVRDKAQFPFGVAMCPAGKQRGTPTGGANFHVFKTATKAERDASLLFVKWATAPERAAQWSIATGYVATQPASWETQAMKDYVVKFPPAAVARDQLQYAVAELSTHENQPVSLPFNAAIQAVYREAK